MGCIMPFNYVVFKDGQDYSDVPTIKLCILVKNVERFTSKWFGSPS